MGQWKGKQKSRLRRPNGKRNHNPTAGSSSSSSAPPPPWIELPRDVTANILRRLAPEEILDAAERVCSTWRSVCREPSFWRVIHMKYSDDLYTDYLAHSMCRRAVDRSQGELIDISIQEFATDGLLRYISGRSSHLKILTLDSCKGISPRGLAAAVKKFPHLEELHLFFFAPIISVSDQDIETIGVSCPMLKSFTFNYHAFCDEVDIYDSIALSIGKNMPNLRCLRLVDSWMTNKGLLAILDGCLNLELLDLLRCCNIDMECDLGRRCSEQVKKLRRPLDSIVGCEWDDYSDDHSDYSYDGYSDNSIGYGTACFSDYGDDRFHHPLDFDF